MSDEKKGGKVFSFQQLVKCFIWSYNPNHVSLHFYLFFGEGKLRLNVQVKFILFIIKQNKEI